RIDSPGFLELDLPHQLFAILERAFQRYQQARSKTIENAFLLVLGIAHLREWIAPRNVVHHSRSPRLAPAAARQDDGDIVAGYFPARVSLRRTVQLDFAAQHACNSESSC